MFKKICFYFIIILFITVHIFEFLRSIIGVSILNNFLFYVQDLSIPVKVVICGIAFITLKGFLSYIDNEELVEQRMDSRGFLFYITVFMLVSGMILITLSMYVLESIPAISKYTGLCSFLGFLLAGSALLILTKKRKQKKKDKIKE